MADIPITLYILVNRADPTLQPRNAHLLESVKHAAPGHEHNRYDTNSVGRSETRTPTEMGPEQPTGAVDSVTVSQVRSPSRQPVQSASVLHRMSHVCAEAYGSAAASMTAKRAAMWAVMRISVEVRLVLSAQGCGERVRGLECGLLCYFLKLCRSSRCWLDDAIVLRG